MAYVTIEVKRWTVAETPVRTIPNFSDRDFERLGIEFIRRPPSITLTEANLVAFVPGDRRSKEVMLDGHE